VRELGYDEVISRQQGIVPCSSGARLRGSPRQLPLMDDPFFSNPTPAPALPSPLLRNLLLFGRLLRAAGIAVTSGQLIELVSSLKWIDIGSKADFRNTARSILVSKHEDLPLFDRAFDIFWRAWTRPTTLEDVESLAGDLAELVDQAETTDSRETRTRNGNHSMSRHSVSAEVGDIDADNPSILTFYSPGEMLHDKDFSEFTRDEVRDAHRFLDEMRWTVTRRRSLRTGPTRRGRRLDVRRSLRRSLRHGGELIDLARRGPKLKRRRLVLLCDISGSMDRYTRLLLHFLHSVESSSQRTEVFVFGTRLTRVTRALQKRDPDSAIAAMAADVKDWSGGTRIGESLRIFNRRWARRVLGQGAIVIVISDGWDRGEPELLAAEMERLQRASYRLIWLNPLLGSGNYQPLTRGIRAALPYVDDFLPVHNLASLEALAAILNEIQEGRPPRKQAVHRLSIHGKDT
jgi:uncharacterized protein